MRDYKNAHWYLSEVPIFTSAQDVIPSRFPVTMVRRRMGSSIPLGSGMGSSHHRETIVYSSLGPMQNETEPLKRGRKRSYGERVEKDGEKKRRKGKVFE